MNAELSYLNLVDGGLDVLLLVGVPGLDGGADGERRVPHALHVLVAQRRRAEAALEGHAALDLLHHRADLGLAEGALVLGRDVGADRQRGGSFAL